VHIIILPLRTGETLVVDATDVKGFWVTANSKSIILLFLGRRGKAYPALLLLEILRVKGFIMKFSAAAGNVRSHSRNLL
jgi:hypothetical protein